MKQFTSDKQKVGKLGEDVAEKFLVKHGFSILDRNYTKKWGEIDIVAEKGNVIHFIEVKAVARKDFVTQETIDYYRPEDNVHPWKLKRLSRTIQTYLLHKKAPDEKEWQLDIMAVFLDMDKRQARVRITENVII